MRRAVPLFFVTLMVGCFDGHGRGGDAGPRGEPDGGLRTCYCCGTYVQWAGDCGAGACDGICNFPPPDAGPLPGPFCRLSDARPLDLICPEVVFAGEAFEMPVAVGGAEQCFCGERVDCVARVGAEPLVLELETSLCSDDGLCDACFPFVEGTCAVPSLGEGRWTVRNNGEDLFELDVSARGVRPERALECTHRRGEDTLMCGVTWPPAAPTQADQVCHPPGAMPGERVTLTVADNCSTCGRFSGPCEVEVFDDIIRVRPSSVDTLCDVDCPSICMRQEHTCVTPPLPEGIWRVMLDDEVTGTSIEVPVGLPPPPDEVCSG